MRFTCSFAHPGTYGHECGKPATLATTVQAKLSGWTGGVFHVHRCENCAKIVGGENARLGTFVPLDPTKHANVWEVSHVK